MKRSFRKLPAGIWALGLGSMFMDTSSELVHSLLPVYMASVLGASVVTIGVIEGTAEATAAVMKVFSGALSDYLGRRKFLVVLGYGLSAATKVVFPLARSISWVFAARFVDRVGKGIRGAPRDALVADIAPAALRGAAYGLRQSLDSVGAFLGPLLALVFMARMADDIRAVFWVAVIPAFIAVALLATVVRDPAERVQGAEAGGKRTPATRADATEPPTPLRLSDAKPRTQLRLSDAKRLRLGYWHVVLAGAVFTLARFSEAFLVLRAQSVGFAIGAIPLVMIVMNVVYAASAYPAGVAADRVSRRSLLLIGLAILIGADIALASAKAAWHVLAGAGLWGLHMGFTQGLFSKLVADSSPEELRGTAFGVFNLVSGAALLLASVVAGLLWTYAGPQATFIAGAAFAFAAAAGILAYRVRPRAGRERARRVGRA